MATCPRCGAPGSGNFCSTCGASLKSKPCPACGTEPEAGARFCNNCGQALAALAPPRADGAPGGARAAVPAPIAAGPPSQLGWWVGGAFMLGLLLILVLPVMRREQPPSFLPAAGAATDISNLTPAEAAFRLWTRVMRADAAGDREEVVTFLPMAIAAHDRARPLDLDGLFHLALLHQTGGDWASALVVAREALGRDPDHLLALAAAAASARELGDPDTARTHYAHFLDVYDAQRARGLTEYQEHQALLEGFHEIAREFTGG